MKSEQVEDVVDFLKRVLCRELRWDDVAMVQAIEARDWAMMLKGVRIALNLVDESLIDKKASLLHTVVLGDGKVWFDIFDELVNRIRSSVVAVEGKEKTKP